jgi:hypothetical protein
MLARDPTQVDAARTSPAGSMEMRVTRAPPGHATVRFHNQEL